MYGFTIMAIDVSPKRTIRKQVEERAATGLCLHCDKPAARLGLCNSHYHQFRMTLLQKAEADRELWKGRQIREGKVLPSGYVRQLDIDNPFEDEA
jgi:Fe-S cluster assembly ATPase SufC